MEKKSSLFREPDLLVACLALAVLIAITLGGVVMRYVVNRPLAWMEEAQLWCFVWVIFPGGSAVARHSGHIAIDAFVGLFPRFLRGMADRLIGIVVVGVLGFITVNSVRHVAQMHATSRVTNILAVPYSLIYAVIPVSCMLMIATALRGLFRPKAGAGKESENV